VLGIIFEARPDVIPQIAALAIKSSNAVIFKGGSEASNSNQMLFQIINNALFSIEEFPENSINIIKTREEVNEMLKLDKYIDLIIPRGGNSLVKFIQSNTKIPVLGHADGICHIYVDENADFEKALAICVDSKIQYPSACNAVETILINQEIREAFLPLLIKKLKDADVVVKGDELTCSFVSDIEKAVEEDWATEYGEKIVSIKVVKDLNEAIEHINNYGSGHTDCIITENTEKAETFMSLVDSAGVYCNASTRFADGFRYGLGAEVGISTNKTHARGPVGLEGLVIYKYKLYGNGQIVAQYTGENPKKFVHKQIK
jgi:glutamate-5-semialdehyde dehydrogenase